jgi:hypothetical protein
MKAKAEPGDVIVRLNVQTWRRLAWGIVTMLAREGFEPTQTGAPTMREASERPQLIIDASIARELQPQLVEDIDSATPVN